MALLYLRFLRLLLVFIFSFSLIPIKILIGFFLFCLLFFDFRYIFLLFWLSLDFNSFTFIFFLTLLFFFLFCLLVCIYFLFPTNHLLLFFPFFIMLIDFVAFRRHFLTFLTITAFVGMEFTFYLFILWNTFFISLFLFHCTPSTMLTISTIFWNLRETPHSFFRRRHIQSAFSPFFLISNTFLL